MLEDVSRIEPARLEDLPEAVADRVAEIAAASAILGRSLHPRTSADLAALVRITNTYYSNLIEGHDTGPRDIERALSGDFDGVPERRNLQLEAAAHVRVQAEIDRLAAAGALGRSASRDFTRWLHFEFYKDAPPELLRVESGGRAFTMTPGVWRSASDPDVAVGRHVPPSGGRVADFMAYFEQRYQPNTMGKAARIVALATAHHRFNYIHPFLDGNGRVSRLMSHAMAAEAGIGAHGLWSISRGLARGLASRGDYKRMMDYADMPRQGDRDGRGNLSERALQTFVLWFLDVCLDQITFMTGLFELPTLSERLRTYVERSPALKAKTANLLEHVLIWGEVDRGDVGRIVGLPERSARRLVVEAMKDGILGSEAPRGTLSLRFPSKALEDLFPRLYPHS